MAGTPLIPRRERAVRARGLSATREPVAVASFPEPIPENRYQQLLYDELARHGITLVRGARFELGWLLRSRGAVSLLHFHWPEPYYRHRRARMRPGRALSWVKVALFTVRLQAARVLGYRILWTVHQALPHERVGKLDELAAGALSRACDLLVAHDYATADDVRRLPGRAAEHVLVVPHGSYVGVYPPGRPRADMRSDLGVDQHATVFLCFGNVRRYKGIELLLSAFAGADLPNTALVVAGAGLDKEVSDSVLAGARRDRRIVPRLEFVPDERVGELFDASDIAVVPRSDGGTSGAIVLALSQGLPLVAARTAAYADLLGHGEAGWLFEPGSESSLRCALLAAASDPEAVGLKGAAALARAERLSWTAIGDRIATAMHEVVA